MGFKTEERDWDSQMELFSFVLWDLRVEFCLCPQISAVHLSVIAYVFVHRTEGRQSPFPCEQEVCLSSKEKQGSRLESASIVSKQLARLPVLCSP